MYVPKAMCGECLVELRPMKNGRTMEVMSGPEGEENTMPYYKIDCDQYGCTKCGKMVFISFASQARAEHFESHYDDIEADVRGYLG